MNGASPRCYANVEERAAFLCQLQALAKRENRGYLADDRNGMPLFQEEIRAVPGGFEWKGVALSPAVQQAAPASLTPSISWLLLKVRFRLRAKRNVVTYSQRGTPQQIMVPTPVRLTNVPTSDRQGVGVGAGRYESKAAWQQSRAARAD